MKTIKKLIALSAVLAMFGTGIQAQEYETATVDDSAAYSDSGNASYLSAALPIGALAVAAIIIATTDNHHHHSSSGNGGHGRRSSSSTFSHAHCY